MSYDLVNAQSYIPSFEILFKTYNIKRVLEYGEGDGTQFLLDKTDFVCSVEVIANASHKGWAKECEKKYAEYKNKKWKQVLLNCSDDMKKADRDRQKNLQPDPSIFEKELQGYIDEGFKFSPFDMVFVDYGIHMRGDIVNLLFNKVDIIAAHDTNVSHSIYGWDKIRVPSNYKEYRYHNEYLGTTFWIKDK